ncbi:uncharacterized protein LOC114518500 [Dendronephthya gigantea]|uniref:uncharacterized protein LOC114518500 n=1 Tax=Dendronephthya gigantea TaxID=151771 RepID=UPI00106A50F5|nr:uncharacterized protein LOC114518500 [Dendronephthya gigantea]
MSKPRRQRNSQTFLEWLLNVLNRKRSPQNAYWLDEEERIFAVRWVHQKSHLYTEECLHLFQLWKNECSRSWRYGSNSAKKSLKTNFRMNLRNSVNFEDLTDIYQNDKMDHEFPMKVFRINRKAQQRRQNATAPSWTETIVNQETQMAHPTVVGFQAQNCIKPLHKETTAEFFTWSNSHTVTTPLMSQYENSGNWLKETQDNKVMNWNGGLSDLAVNSRDLINGLDSSSHPGNPLISLELGLNRNYILGTDLAPCQEEERRIANPFKPLNLDANCYLDCIPNIDTSFFPGSNSLYYPVNDPKMVKDGTTVLSLLSTENIDSQCSARPNNNTLGTNEIQYTVPLRHPLVTSPTHSEIIDRSSPTQSYSSAWSGDDSSGQIFDEFDGIFPFDDYSDSVFD